MLIMTTTKLFSILVIVLLLVLSVRPITAEQKTVCWSYTAVISCYTGKRIHIVSALYGRKDITTCDQFRYGTQIANWDITCDGSGDTDIVSGMCNGRQYCNVKASNSVFGEPCHGTPKYLDIVYECLTLDVKTVCWSYTAVISCPIGKRIHIVSALYGRKDITTCDQFLYGTQISNWDVTCGGPGDTDVVSGKCNGQQYCNVKASNSVFGEPCLFTPKYLVIEYVCLDVKAEQKTVCWSYTAVISCPIGKRIHIVSAMYGRKDITTCDQFLYGTQIANWDVTCDGSGDTDIVSGMCNGRQYCNVKASNSVFGEPCLYTPKYLDIVYVCLDVKTVCWSYTAVISCPIGKRIHIASALYGRQDNTTCDQFLYSTQIANWNVTCSGTGDTDVVSGKCNGQQYCNVKASNSVFGEPCLYTPKYLDIVYDCLAVKTVCWSYTALIYCPIGKRIHIVSALYGRKDITTCYQFLYGTQIANWDVTCGGPGDTDVVSGKCDGRQYCYVHASNSVFGEPCYGTPKYLDIVYDCLDG